MGSTKRYKNTYPRLQRPFITVTQAVQRLKSRARHGPRDSTALYSIKMLEQLGYEVTDSTYPMKFKKVRAGGRYFPTKKKGALTNAS